MEKKLIMTFFDYTITPFLPDIKLPGKTIVNTINPHSYCVAQEDEKFKKALKTSHFLLPDGIGIVIAVKVLNRKKIEKIAGYDVFIHLMNQLNENEGSCFFLGATQETLIKINKRLEKDFPKVKVANYSPPYKPEFNVEDSRVMCEAVNAFKPNVLFVGMTAPKQEKWVHQYKDNLDSKIICSIGAVFDFYAETVKRPSQFWIKSGLEWLPRFLKEPKRLARRNLISTPTFMFAVIKEKFKRKVL